MRIFILLIIGVLFPSIPILAEEMPKIVSMQYWIDDNSESNTTKVVGEEMEFDIDVSSLPTGLHFLHYRVSDDAGKYSQLYQHGFLKVANRVAVDSVSNIQYWWDDMVDNAATVAYSSEEFVLSIGALPYGLHRLNFRVMDNAGRGSGSQSHYFYKGESLDSALIVSYSIWWNDLTDDVISKSLDTPLKTLIIDEDIVVPDAAITYDAGYYRATLHIRIVDNRGRSTYLTEDVAYPDNDAPVTDIDASSYVCSASEEVKISWTEKTNDEMGDYNVYVSENDHPFYLWCPDTRETSKMFHGVAGNNYRFTVTGRDAAGNREKFNESKCVSVTFE